MSRLVSQDSPLIGQAKKTTWNGFIPTPTPDEGEKTCALSASFLTGAGLAFDAYFVKKAVLARGIFPAASTAFLGAHNSQVLFSAECDNSLTALFRKLLRLI